MFSSQKCADEVGPINGYMRDRVEPHKVQTHMGSKERNMKEEDLRSKVGLLGECSHGEKDSGGWWANRTEGMAGRGNISSC